MNIREFINNILLVVTLLAFLAQFFIDFSSENIACACIVFSGAVTTLLYMRWTPATFTHPLSTFAILGFTITSELGALLAQSGAGVSLINGLRQPTSTFLTLTFYLFIAITAHSFYRVFFNPNSAEKSKTSVLRSLLEKLGIYTTPSAVNLWIIGFVGMLALFASFGNAIARGLSFLAWAPFLIPLYRKQIGPDYCNAKLHYVLLIGYFVLVVLFAMSHGARGIMFTGLVTVALIFLLLGMQNEKKVGSKLVAKVVAFGLLGLMLSWPASDLVTAMAIAKVHRDKNATAEKMIEDIFYNFQRPEVLEDYRSKVYLGALTKSYDEFYIQNPILARFTETKFHDNTMYFASKISSRGSEDLMKVTTDFLWAALPQPVLDLLKINVNKVDLAFSMGDYIVEQATGLPVGGRKTGSIFAQGSILFGEFFPVIYFLACFILFASIDLFSFRSPTGIASISALGMLKIWPTFLYGITGESIHAVFITVVRGVVQTTFMYLLVFIFAKIVTAFFVVERKKSLVRSR